jgi:hypothetical protein
VPLPSGIMCVKPLVSIAHVNKLIYYNHISNKPLFNVSSEILRYAARGSVVG